jgi:hypothetical protein
MIDSLAIKKMAAHIIQHERGARDRQLVHPIREWMSGIIVVSIGVVIGGGVSFFMYKTTREVDMSAAIPVPTISYHSDVVTRANQKYEKRRAEYDALIGKKSTLSPSLDQASSTVVSSSTESTSTEVVSRAGDAATAPIISQ